MNNWLDIVLLIPSSVVGAFCIPCYIRALVAQRKAIKEGRPRPPGVGFTLHWFGSIGLLSGLVCLLSLTAIAAEHEGFWRVAPLALINLIMQPLCLFMIALGLYNMRHAVCGRASWGFRVLPREGVSTKERRGFLISCIFGGMFLVLFFSALAYACASPLLWPSPSTIN